MGGEGGWHMAVVTTVAAIEHVTVRRGERALLDDVSLDLLAGEVVALVGANGAGKTTLLGVVAGDLDPTAGRVLLHGREVGSIPAGELALIRSVQPQQTLLQFGFLGREVVEMGRNPLPAGRRDDDERVITAAMASTDASHLADRRFPTLSGGEQMRVSLARVLAQEAPLLLFDEPTASLDARHQHTVMEVARAFAANGATVLCILHDLNLALAYADRLAVMAQGRIIACDAPWPIANSGVLADAFACPVSVLKHPHRDCPMVVTWGAGTGTCFLRHRIGDGNAP